MWHMHTMEFYLVIKETEIMTFAQKSMELEMIILSKATQNNNDFKFSLLCR